MYAVIMSITAFFSGISLGRLAYDIFLDFRTALPWLLGHAEDSNSDQVRLLTFVAAATVADSGFAIFNGYPPVWSIILTPFAVTWVAEVILSVHRLFGPVFEKFVVDWHPIDIFYSGTKRGLNYMWSNKQSLSAPSLPFVGRRRREATTTDPATTDASTVLGEAEHE